MKNLGLCLLTGSPFVGFFVPSARLPRRLKKTETTAPTSSAS